jgi:hypothetical protein
VSSIQSIEFLYYPDCPSHDRALALLHAVAAGEGLDAPVTVIRVETDDEAQRYGFYGSPTIRVDGVDIAPLPDDMPRPALTCRAYRTPEGRISPLPPRDLIVAALRRPASDDPAERND